MVVPAAVGRGLTPAGFALGVALSLPGAALTQPAAPPSAAPPSAASPSAASPPAAVLARASAGAAAAISAPAVRAGEDVLRLSDVYAEVLARNPRVVAARALARAAGARVASTRRPPDPQLQLGFMNYTLPALRPMDPLGMTQLQVMQMVPVAGKLGLAGTSAGARAEAEAARATDVAWELRARAAAAFYEVASYDRSIAIAAETRRLLEDLARIAATMYRVGEGRQADVLRAQVEIARMDEELVRMRAMRTAAAGRLNALLDRAADAPVPTAALPAFPDATPPLAALQAAAQDGRPMLRAGRDEVRAAQAAETLARRELWPDLQVGVQLGQRPMPVTADGMGGGTERMGSLMLGASVPIFARSRQLQMREEAAAMRQMAGADLAAMRADTRARVTEAYADLTRARNLQALYRTTVLPQAEVSVTSSLAAYRVGSVPFMTLVDSRMTVNRYRQELSTLEAEEGRAWAELEMLLGAPLFDPGIARETAARETGVIPGAASPSDATPRVTGVSAPAAPIHSSPTSGRARRVAPARPGGAP